MLHDACGLAAPLHVHIGICDVLQCTYWDCTQELLDACGLAPEVGGLACRRRLHESDRHCSNAL